MRKIELMHSIFGTVEDKTCKTCDHLVCRIYSRRYYKCDVYSLSNSAASDWKVSNQACGMYNKPYDGYPVMRLSAYEKGKEPQVEGQISFFRREVRNYEDEI